MLGGELVSVAAEPGENHAKSLAILEPSGERVAPVCPHVGTCGGCAYGYLAWKREQVVGALGSRGLARLEGRVCALRALFSMRGQS